MTQCSHEAITPDAPLAPRRARAVVVVVLVLIALASIGLIDRRAMQRMHEVSSHSSPLGERLGEG